MGVFLSKPSLTKFSEDGEDDALGFGVSSMQGWRRNMEDAHLALLDVKREGAEGGGTGDAGGESGGGGEEQKEGATDKIRMFGVFDGHGGKEVALFVQEHMAEELVKLEEYREGDFPGALVRVFHRMDELLEGAATELLRSRGMLPEEGGDNSQGAEKPGGDAVSEKPGGHEGEGGGDGKGEEGAMGGGAERSPAEEEAERYKEILRELTEFRSRKNPSDVESGGPPNKGRPMLGSADDYDSDEDTDEPGAEAEAQNRGDDDNAIDVSAGNKTGNNNQEDDDDDVLELGTAGGANGGRKIKMADALDLFHRILDIRKDQQRTKAAAAAAAAVPLTATTGGGDENDASPCPPLGNTQTSDGASGDQTARSARGDGEGTGVVSLVGGDSHGAADAGPADGGAAAMAAVETAAWVSDEGDGEASPPEGAGGADEEGEDTFGDSDESEEDDIVVTPTSMSLKPNGTGGAGAGDRPRQGLGQSLASIVHGQGGNAPTCKLQDHPIQAGCTSVVCLMVGKKLHVANAGDSRAVLCRGGVAVALSHDHKPMSVTERSRIEGAGGFVNAAGRVNGNLNLSRSIGDLKYKATSGLPPADQMITAQPDLESVEVTAEDRFMILACDGVWDCMTSQECVDFVGARIGKMSLSKVCEEVMDACLSDDPRRTTGIGGDNMTCIVVLLDKKFSAAEASASSSPEDKKESGASIASGAGGGADAGASDTGTAAAALSPELEEGKE